MHLLAINQTYSFNETQIDLVQLSCIYLIAFCFRIPSDSSLFFLYGLTNGNSSQYQSLHLIVRQSGSPNTFQNITLSQDYKCQIGCEIKVTEFLLMIESQSLIGIYKLDLWTFNAYVPPIFTQQKAPNSYLTQIFRQADIYHDKFIVYNQTNNASSIIFGIGSINTPVRVVQQFPWNFNGPIIEIGISATTAYLVANHHNAILNIYHCVACIYNGSISNNTNFNSVTMQINLFQTVNRHLRIHMWQQYYPSYAATLGNGKFYLVFNSGQQVAKYQINATDYTLIYNIAESEYFSAGQDSILTYGADTNIRIFYHGQYINHPTAYNSPLPIKKLKATSQLLALTIQYNHWGLKLYIKAAKCTDYYAITNRTYPLFCQCYNYTSVVCQQCNKCSQPGQQANQKGLPIIVIMGAIVAIIGVVLAFIIIKRYYKRCTNQTAIANQNPKQLVSFEVSIEEV